MTCTSARVRRIITYIDSDALGNFDTRINKNRQKKKK